MKQTAGQKPYPVHVLPGRARVATPGLPGDPALWTDFTGRLARLPGVRQVRGNAVSRRLLILYDPARLSLPELLSEIFSLSRDFPDQPGRPASRKGRESSNNGGGGAASGGAPAGPANSVPEPEDLPLSRQFFNVAAGGAVLAALGAKRLTRGVSPLAGSPALFNLAAATAVVTGYPLLKSGLARFSGQRQVTFDLLLGALSLGTLLLRESIPGLLVVWLANLNSLLQALLLAGARRLLQDQAAAAPEPERTAAGIAAGPPAIPAAEQTPWAPNIPSPPGVLYGRRMAPVAGGLAALSGLFSRRFDRPLAALLAASPAPAGLARPGALYAGLALARRAGASVTDPAALTGLAHAGTLLLVNGWGLQVTVRAGGFYTFFDHEPDAAAALLFTALRQNGHPLSSLFAPGRDQKQEITMPAAVAAGPEILLESAAQPILVGGAEFLQRHGVSAAPGIFKARRLATLGEIPLFLARGGRLAAVTGIVCRPAPETAAALQKLSLSGIKIVAAVAQPDFYRPLERETGLTVYPLQEAQSLLDGLRATGKTVVAAGGENTPGLLRGAGVTVGAVRRVPAGAPVLPGIIFDRPDLEKLARLFAVSFGAARQEKENVALTALFNSLGLLLGVSGRLAPVPASLYNNLISLLVLLNSYRLLFFPAEGPPARPPGRPAPEKNLFPAEGEKETAAGRLPPSSPPSSPLPSLLSPAPVPGLSGPPRPAAVLSAASPAGETGISLPGERNAAGEVSRTNRPGPGALSGAWPTLEAAEVLRLLRTSAAGLNREEAGRRLARYGLNQLPAVSPPGLLVRVLNQFKNFLVQTLMGSGVLCFLLGEIADSLAILAILAFNALLGALQEHRAEDALRALKEMTVPLARVKRDGEWRLLPSPLLVPGDILLLAAGDGVPADARILQAVSFQVNEAALTGEAYPVQKTNTPLPGCVTLIDCHNMVFLGTTVSRGRALAVVTATGRKTELGKIAGMLEGEEDGPTPLQRSLAVVGKKVLAGSLAVSGLVFLAGVLRRQPPLHMFLTGISLAVAAIPEGLPAIVTVALAAGVHRMARENALVRRLAAVENIGGVTVICTDKTGTLTKNEQVVQTVVCADQSRWERNGDGVLAPAGAPGGAGAGADHQTLLFFLAAGILAGSAWREQEKMSGDPLEKGILFAAEKAGLAPAELSRIYRLAAENPFDAERRYVSMVYQQRPAGEFYSFLKGAPEVIGEHCTSYLTARGPAPFTKAARRYFAAVNSRLAARALRVLAVAYRPLAKFCPADGKPGPEAENELIFLGLLGMFDPPRPEVRAAIEKCAHAGVKVVMITGDQRDTALAVGRMLGLAQKQTPVYTGNELENLNDAQLAEVIREGRLFARVLPAHKLRLVKAFRQQGERVAMIGDGVNDAPAVQEADVGLAMGRTGTDVTKEAADIVLTDDNFATVVAAVEQGRGIYDNVLRSVRYLLATNLGEIFLVLFSVLAGLPLPLLPIQLLWLNLLGDSFPALALSLDRPASNVMDRPPRDPQSSFAGRDSTVPIAARGLTTGLSSLSVYWWGLKGGDLVRARTLALTSLTVSQLLYALDCQPERPAEKTGRRLTGAATALSGGLLLGALYYPPAAGLFQTAPLGLKDWLAAGLGAGLPNLLDRVLRPALPRGKDSERL